MKPVRPDQRAAAPGSEREVVLVGVFVSMCVWAGSKVKAHVTHVTCLLGAMAHWTQERSEQTSG